MDDDDVFEGYYLVITEDLNVLWCQKVRDTVTDEEAAPYAGKYLLFGNYGEVAFPSEDPTTFYLGSEWLLGTNLQLNSFDFTSVGSDPNSHPCIRVEPFEYIMIEDD